MLYQTLGANARGQIVKAYLGDGSRTTNNFIKNTDRLAFTNAASGASNVQNLVYTFCNPLVFSDHSEVEG